MTDADIWDDFGLRKSFLPTLGISPLRFIYKENVKYLKKEHLRKILNFENKRVVPEYHFFMLASMWAENECLNRQLELTPANKRYVLDDLFYLIRFPTMTTNDLHRCYNGQDGLFSDDEINNLISFIEGCDCDLKFVTKNRNS